MSKKSKDSHAIGSTLRDRGKKPATDIGDLWAQQIVEERRSKDKRRSPQSFDIKKQLASLSKKLPKVPVPRISRRLNKKHIAVLAVLVLSLAVRTFSASSTVNDTPEQLGVSTASVPAEPAPPTEGGLVPAVTETEFEILWPQDADSDTTEVVKVSPPDNDPVYAYIAIFNGAELRVSQQQIPDSFKDNVAEKVKEVATSFQAQDVIQVDDTKIYHGFSDKNGGVQSLVFEKNDILVLVASPLKLPDTQWASYVSTFK